MTDEGDVSFGRRRIAAVLVGAMALAATAEWHTVFGWSALVPVAGAAVVPVLVAVAGGSPRRPLAATGTLSALGLVVMLGVAQRSPSPAGLVDGLVHGWSRILSTTLEVPATDGRLLLPVATVGAAALVGGEMALRLARRPALAALAPLAAYALALPFEAGGPADRAGTLTALAVLSLGLATLVVLVTAPVVPHTRSMDVAADHPRGRTATTRRGIGAAAVLALCPVAALVAGPRLPLPGRADPYDPRADQHPPLDDVEAIDPLSLLAGWALDDDDPVLFTVEGPAADRWRLAVLDRYDPALGWSSRAEYVAAGSAIPTDEPAGSGSVDRTVTIGDLDGVWLPTTGRPLAADAPDLYVDPTTAMLVTRGELSRGQEYSLTSSTGRRAGCDAADAAAPAPTGSDEEVPSEEIVTYAATVTRGATSTCQKAQLIESYLRGDRFAYSAEAPSGSTLARIESLLQPGRRAHSGTSEQFVTAFALLARASGLDARVVVGFDRGEKSGRSHRVHASDAHAWAEVLFEGTGWVTFDPTPSDDDAEQAPVTAPPVTQPPTTTAAQTTLPTTTTPTSPTTTPRPPERSTPSRFLSVGALAVGLPAVVLGAAAAAVALIRRQRRSARRRLPAPADRLVGAWRQCLVELRGGGVRFPSASTATDCVHQVADAIDADLAGDLTPVAVLANRALFGGVVTDDDAEQAWRSTDRLAAGVGQRRSFPRRITHALDLRAVRHS
jgi:hypothetical protein